ncbi:Gmad2 immunoglobulin-like domain-containing protein [Egicoccus sp. AB-alg2]|uniref:Gmad2 immunoglobulin-like domain-containing protein n=1 Tax=Egicoccus sp. AB-alg2 TaxID=3242693 RepID=UPI00359D1D86
MRRPVLRSAVVTLALLLAACGGQGGSEPSLVDPTEPADEQPAEPETEADEADEPEPQTEGDTADDVEEPAQEADNGTDDTADDDAQAGDDANGATPDPAALEDPCADHQGREGDAFIEVVSPVAEQQVEDLGAVELVGCSNVFEANVQWELYDGDGRLLDEGFTTAECGSGCVGAFREELDLTAAEGEPFAELHVFSESAADGSREYLTAVPLVLG